MADLLSDAQHALIRSKMQDVVDTFADTQVNYYLGGVFVDDFMEDNDNVGSKSYTLYELKGLVEYITTDDNKTITSPSGKIHDAEIMITLGMDDLDALGLVSNNIPIFREEEDYMIVNGERYNVLLGVPEGPLQQKNVLVVVYGKLDEKQA